ncbi:MAG: hypothetical protein CO187_01020 [Zetaproteobacteria bacterium CG_4_9_14_3_um_filter_53_7]|nr:MAG: hypothetical protein CO187_01020 [Zetaproteobacteria bacterium CG_4_9_14_3_um_filter_53_7]
MATNYSGENSGVNESKRSQWERPMLIQLNSSGTEGKLWKTATENHTSASGKAVFNSYGPS